MQIRGWKKETPMDGRQRKRSTSWEKKTNCNWVSYHECHGAGRQCQSHQRGNSKRMSSGQRQGAKRAGELRSASATGQLPICQIDANPDCYSLKWPSGKLTWIQLIRQGNCSTSNGRTHDNTVNLLSAHAPSKALSNELSLPASSTWKQLLCRLLVR